MDNKKKEAEKMTRAFLIGAGATKAQYGFAPLCNDFFGLLHAQDGPLFEHIKNLFQPFIGKQDLRNKNIEDMMKIVSTMAPSIKNTLNLTLYNAIYRLIAETTGSHEDYMIRYIQGELIEPPTTFCSLMTDKRLHPEDFFMTLNYDLYLDREILSYQHTIDYGISNDYLNSVGISYENHNKYSCYHLHGALNWINAGQKLDIRRGAIKPKTTIEGVNLCIVPPGEKNFSPVLKSLWDLANQRLEKVSELIIIGCSLNKDDSELREMISKYLLKHNPNTIKIIDRTEDEFQSKKYYEDIIGPNILYHPYGFNLQAPYNFKGAIEFIFK